MDLACGKLALVFFRDSLAPCLKMAITPNDAEPLICYQLDVPVVLETGILPAEAERKIGMSSRQSHSAECMVNIGGPVLGSTFKHHVQCDDQRRHSIRGFTTLWRLRPDHKAQAIPFSRHLSYSRHVASELRSGHAPEGIHISHIDLAIPAHVNVAVLCAVVLEASPSKRLNVTQQTEAA